MGDAAGQQEYPAYPGWAPGQADQAAWGQSGYPQYEGYPATADPWAQQNYQQPADQTNQEPGPPGEEQPPSQEESAPAHEHSATGNSAAGPPGYYYPQQEQHPSYPPQTNGYPPPYQPGYAYQYPPPQPAYNANGYGYDQAQAPAYPPSQSGQGDAAAAYQASSQYNNYQGAYSHMPYDAQQAYQQQVYAQYPPQAPQQYDYSQWPEYAATTPGNASGASAGPLPVSTQAFKTSGGYVQEFAATPPVALANANTAAPSYADVVAQRQAAELGVTPEAALALATHLAQTRGGQQYAAQSSQPQTQPQEQILMSKGPSQTQQAPREWTWNTGKMQIPTNPRLAGNFAGKQKPLPKEPAQPAYLKVEGQEHPEAERGGDSKPGEFPPSLKGYVKRCFERCKTDEQRKGVEGALQEIIKTATRDGTLRTTDWDTEPYPSVLTSPALLSGAKTGPGERKSRWEPEAPATSSDPGKRTRWEAEKDSTANGHSSLSSRLGFRKSKNLAWVRGQSPEKGKPKASPRGRKRGRKAAAVDTEASSSTDSEGGVTPGKKGLGKPTPEEVNRRERRSRRFEKGDGKKGRRREPVAGEASLRKDRAAMLMAAAGQGAAEDVDWSTMTVKGTSQTVEKKFLRLTAAPDPSTVRPESVLHKALAMVQTTDKDYYYRCDQLKSIRQDLTVQRIRNEFTVRVYETHARMALEFGDVAEFNQCQAQLKILYKEGLPGCVPEFAAYRLLYIVFHQTAGSADLLSELKTLSLDLKSSPPVLHALKIRAAYSAHDYVKFFRLYDSAPNLNKRLLDLRADKVRFEAVKRMTKAFRPHLQVSEVARVLGFCHAGASSADVTSEEVEDCEEWLTAHGATIATEKGELLLDTKASQNSLFVPVPAEAVAHGDANLAVDAFFSKRILS